MKRLIAAALLAAVAAPAQAEDIETAIVAGGCFWCVESDFDKVPGVLETVSGYTGGDTENPTYHQVSSGGTGHYEAVRITYDADVVDYRTLIDTFWRTIDPTDAGGQFCDRGTSYRTAVFATTPEQAEAAEASRAAAEQALGREIVTPVLDAGAFWPAEDYHQNYYKKNPLRYTFYRRSCGRDARLRQLWGDQAFHGTPAG
jgi:peptide-methionine (S)-S-oxide reductase